MRRSDRTEAQPVMRQVAAAWTLLRQPRRVPTLVVLKLLSQKRLRPLVFAAADWRDRRVGPNGTCARVPPAALRYRVHGDLSPASFRASGKQTLADVKHALAQAGTDLGACRHILDFGCGCGRTLLWLSRDAPSADVHGTDVDGDAIAWCRHALPDVTVTVNAPLPPLPYPAEHFDLIYAISVFTHLDETYQFRWLDELRRVAKPGGYVLVTLHGAYYWNTLAPQMVETIKTSGCVVAKNPKFVDGIFPEWYQTTFHAPDYVTRQYSRYFDIASYVPAGLDSCQDVVLLRKR